MNTYSPKILLTGANGQVGSAIRHHAKASEYNFVFCSREQFDITDKNAIDKIITQSRPDIIINAAAYTAVDKAEEEIDLAMQINHLGVQNLAIVCQKHRIPLLHLSTDYIFDGKKKSPYQEKDKPHPLNVYGQSKWLGEEAVRDQCDQYIILRTSGVFSEYGNNFLKTILKLAKTRTELRIVADQLTCPTYASDIATALFSIIGKLSHWGTYHFCSKNPVSWYEFTLKIIEEARHSERLSVEKIDAISAEEYQAKAIRPAYSVLDCKKIERDYAILAASWEEALISIFKNKVTAL